MNKAQRQEFLDQSRAHYASDMLLKGTYGSDESGAFRGCSVGCHARNIVSEESERHHATVADHYGYPEWLVRLQDTIFEGLPDGDCNRWHVQLAETLYALPDDYNWQAAMHRVLAGIMRVALQRAGSAAPVVQAVIDLHDRAAQGESVNESEWTEAARACAAWAAEAAEAACAAWAARAVGAARAAAEAVGAEAYQQIRDAVLAALCAKGRSVMTHDSDSATNNGPATDDAQLAKWEDLIGDLDAGVMSCGMHDDNSTELFLIDDANDTMSDAREAISALIGMVRERDAEKFNWLYRVEEAESRQKQAEARATAAEARLKDLEGDPEGTAAHVEAFMNRATVAEADAAAARKRVRELENEVEQLRTAGTILARRIAKATDHASTSPGPVNCLIRARFQTSMALPRQCARCGLGPCPFFNQDGSDLGSQA